MIRTATQNMKEALKTYSERNLTYGDTYKNHGNVMKALYPKGITLRTVDEFNRFGVLNMIVSKLTRLTLGDDLHTDSAHDMGVYSFMLEELQRERLAEIESYEADLLELVG